MDPDLHRWTPADLLDILSRWPLATTGLPIGLVSGTTARVPSNFDRPIQHSQHFVFIAFHYCIAQ